MTAKKSSSEAPRKPKPKNGADSHLGEGSELHQVASGSAARLTTNQGTTLSDDQNSLRVGARGPTLLEDFVLREKITHFDHERIPERIVHARGFGAHGYFQPDKSHASLTKAGFLQDPAQKTPVFVRFSTVAGSEGSADLARDVRGFAVKFYTQEGNYDLVGNNIPVFFIQDAMKFPDLVHSVKPEPDRGFPQAASAHDTFWDFVSLMPESTHMLMWVMSDRAIPRSFRMMEGFGVHTFRMVNAPGKSTFVKFHFRPKLGTFSLIWDEALKLNGADPDFHRRDLWEAIEGGDFPEWAFSVQAFDEKTAESFDFDVLDPTKLIPEELVPLTKLGTLVLNRNVDNFFDETDQVAFCPSHLVPGIEFSNDPLLQGRVFSYLDTQLSRLGSPNFHELPINAPKCPWHNMQRGGHMRSTRATGRVAYSPNSLDQEAPREDPERGFHSVAVPEGGEKLRVRSASFSDHYSQARLFWTSMTKPERLHIASAFAFELAKVKTKAVRTRMLGQLAHVDKQLLHTVEKALGMEGQADDIKAATEVLDMAPSPALSQLSKAPHTLKGRKIGVLVTDGVDDAQLRAIQERAQKEGAKVELVAPTIGGVSSRKNLTIEVDHALSGGPSMLFDAVIVAPSESGVAALLTQAAAIEWVHNAFVHLKVVGFVPEAEPLLRAAHVELTADEGIVSLDDGLDGFIAAASKHRIWSREAKVRNPG